ncbi:MAG: LPS assembly lipoprotein LptE [Gemmatimonadaceae bacterium]
MKRFGVVSIVLATCLLTGCFYSLSGGGGLPKQIRTVAVIPFENETANPEITAELHQELRKTLLDRLGLRDASEQRANAVVTGKITAYEPDVPIGFSADPTRSTSARRRLQLTVDVQIVDQTTGRTLFEKKGVSAEGEYAEREEPAGRKQAIQRVVNDIVEGAQSQW